MQIHLISILMTIIVECITIIVNHTSLYVSRGQTNNANYYGQITI